ncbi:MAG: RNA methyltransferase [Bacteroidota bacterium]
MRKLKLQELNRLTVTDFKKVEKSPIVVVLDNVRSGLNVGSAFRTADGFALEHIYLCGITAQPPHREILKTAIGATDSMDWTYLEETATAVRQLQAEGYYVVAIEQAEGSTSLPNFQWPEGTKIALVFGNEVRGVSQAAMDLVDECVEVPQFGTKHSFNISVCIGIVVWEIFRKWRFC